MAGLVLHMQGTSSINASSGGKPKPSYKLGKSNPLDRFNILANCPSVRRPTGCIFPPLAEVNSAENPFGDFPTTTK
ncbi:hypothetical protein O8C22_26325 [Agrobacterium rhizogenes]|nr:hypothetical protein [Rhizobium rhizogenes]MCZ7484176.1 hypothetical protein [Rhizobium rhizogenes]